MTDTTEPAIDDALALQLTALEAAGVSGDAAYRHLTLFPHERGQLEEAGRKLIRERADAQAAAAYAASPEGIRERLQATQAEERQRDEDRELARAAARAQGLPADDVAKLSDRELSLVSGLPLEAETPRRESMSRIVTEGNVSSDETPDAATLAEYREFMAELESKR